MSFREIQFISLFVSSVFFLSSLLTCSLGVATFVKCHVGSSLAGKEAIQLYSFLSVCELNAMGFDEYWRASERKDAGSLFKMPTGFSLVVIPLVGRRVSSEFYTLHKFFNVLSFKSKQFS